MICISVRLLPKNQGTYGRGATLVQTALVQIEVLVGHPGTDVVQLRSELGLDIWHYKSLTESIHSTESKIIYSFGPIY